MEQARNYGIKESQDLNQAYGLAKQVTYQDGFGRPMQQIAVNEAPGTGKDLIQPFRYGPQGEQTRLYLPYAQGTNGRYKDLWEADQAEFYESVSPKVGRPGNGPTYSEVVADNDPLGRVAEKASPGEAWKLSGGHTQRTVQRSNTSNDGVRLWTYAPAAGIPAPGTDVTGILGWAGTAGANTLTAVEVRDEDSNWAVVFTNEKGQTVCRRTYLSGTPSQLPASATYLETNYAYDAAGRLLAVIPPKAGQQLLGNTATATSAFLHQYLFLTHYDALGRPVARKVPGKGWTFTVYDRWDRVAAAQDLNQYNRGVWSFVKYDALNRAVMTGEVYDSRNAATLAAALQSWPVDQRAEGRANNETGYTLNRTFPETIQESAVATVDYYDDYGYFPLSAGQRPDLAFVAEMGYTAASTQTRGMRTGGRKRVLYAQEYDLWLTTAVYYDEHGRGVQVLADNFTLNAGGTAPAVDRTTTTFLPTGEVAGTLLTHRRYNAAGTLETHTTETQNDYDGKGNLIQTYESIDEAPYVYINGFEYNELGQVVDKKLGYDYTNSSYIQSLDYRYNIRGWLTNINNRNLSNNQWLDNSTPNSDTEPTDAFGLELKYESGGTGAGCYNGNISAAIWNTGRMRQYGYSYDKASRLTSGQYSALDYVGGNYVWTAEKYDALNEGLYTTSGITYDPNGNITALSRSGLVSRNASTGAKVFGRIDELAFAHDGNRLRTVTDGIPATAASNDFENGPTTGATYEYDNNGNLTRDPNKKLTIYYNQLNLPWLFQFDNYTYILNVYTATGEKISTVYDAYTPNVGYTATKTVQYIQGFTHSTSAQEPLTVNTPTGRAIFEAAATSSSPAQWAHEYHIRDHQGSLRLVLKQEPVVSYQLTMEPTNASAEEARFQRVSETRQLDASHARTGTHSARLNARQVDRANGPATVLTVAAGDSVHLEIFGLYDRGIAAPRLSKAVVPVLAIGGSLTLPPTGPDNQTRSQRRWVPAITAGVAVAWDNLRGLLGKREALPQASFTYEFYNKDSVLVTSSTQLLAEQGQPEWQQLAHGFRAPEAGYVKVYLANASDTNAWFDDAIVTVFPVPTQQENHYDPFGQNLEEIELAGSFDSQQQYTGKERVSNFGLALTDYGARWYDTQLGQWHSTDPINQFESPYNAMGNNPVNRVDIDGRFTPFVVIASAILESAATAAFINAAYQLSSNEKFNWGELAGSAVGGAVVGGMALAPNKFLVKGSLTRKYVGKALYAGLAAEVGSVAGQLTSDLINDGKVGDVGSYLKNGLPAAGIAMATSALFSAYDYMSWDRYTPQEKVKMLREEFGNDFGYNEKMIPEHAGETNMKTGHVDIGNTGLTSRGIARATLDHEFSHSRDVKEFGPWGINYSGGDFMAFTESKAYTRSLGFISNNSIQSRYYFGSWQWSKSG